MQIEKRLNEDFENLCDRFVDNKLSVHFAEDKKMESTEHLSIKNQI